MLIKIDNPILGFIDFKSAKGGGKKCVKGKVCGLTCIAKGRVCRIELKGANKAASKWLVSQNTSADDGSPTMKGRIERGIELYREELKAIDLAMAEQQSARANAWVLYDQAVEEIKAFRAQNPDQPIPRLLLSSLANASKEQQRLDRIANNSEVDKIFGVLRDKMLANGDIATAAGRVDRISIDDSLPTVKGSNQSVEDELKDLHRISSNRVERLNKVWQDPDRERAYADDEGIINVGKVDDLVNPRALWHEFGHHIEFEDDNVKAAANDFIQQRRDGSPPQRLNELAPGSNYNDDEMAYPGRFIDPYMGKVYDDGGTEVISMGLEGFRSTETMRKLYRDDPELFTFMLGVLS